MDELDNNYYAGGLLQKMRDCKVSNSPGELAMSHTKPNNQEMNRTIKNESIDSSYFIKQETIDEAEDNYTSELLQKMRDCKVSHSPGELMMPHTKPDNQEMNETIKNESIDGCMDECIDISDDHNNIIRLLPRRPRYETENMAVSFYGAENYEIDIIDRYVFEGFVCSKSHSSEFIACVNSDLL
ncbi:uncharacterized protein LOC100568891 [Acyrthosiphon pisum]|uniref:Uncharacterized protein n=1 Tax=Acyrthosiphon pisum TaxID=7029 RepID=A0A8R2B4C4_ACYPI|nr:uncharacterized protein LOC100568891 [Acyrthosiphon pisum]|eukprot:XP_008181172.2 PREDICTED: uncharacterized protein LOC100568891 [Acyrthosiphon pisum]